MRNSHIALVLGGIAIVLGLFIAVRVVFPAAQTAATGTISQPIRIGAALGLSGECANYGEGELKAVELAISEANASGGIEGRQLKLVSEDTLCSPEGSVNAMKKLIEADHVEGIIGLTWGDSFQAGFTVNNAAHIPAIAPSAALEALFYNKASVTYTYSTWFPEVDEIDALENQAQKMGRMRFVIVHDTDTYGAMLALQFVKQAPEHNLQIMGEYSVPVGTQDFRTIIIQIKNKHPDGVALFFQAPSAKTSFLKQARDLGLSVQAFTDASIEDASLLKNYSGVMEGLIYTRPRTTGDVSSFSQKFKVMHGVDAVGASDANAYDAARVLIAALTDHYKNGTDLNAAIAHVDIPGTAVARIRFDDSHQITGAEFQIKTVENGQFVVLQ